MIKLRLITDEGDGAYNMALDEAMLILRSVNVIPDTLRLYVFKPSTITIGYFQSINESVNEDFIKSRRIPIVRRPTGGGAVYHDTYGEITYSIIISEDKVPRDYVESFKFLAKGVIRAARILGAPAEFKPLNDGVIAGKKFSGQAQLRRLGVVLQHGTFMYATDIDTLAQSLLAPKLKLKQKGVRVIKERVITISNYVGRKISRDEALEALIRGFSEALKAKLMEGSLTEVELQLASSLKWKYLSKAWTYLRP